MAATRTNYWKIGLFVVAGVVAGVTALFWIGAHRLNRRWSPRVTYFDESVQGLDVGAPLKMRGVTVGSVLDITLAPDQRLVQVTSKVFSDVWVRLGLGTEEELRTASAPLPLDLRVQLATTGITGEKFLLVDFFPNASPPPELGFDPPYNYVPSTSSTLKSLEDGVILLADLLPSVLARLDALAATFDEKLGAVDTEALSRRLDDLLAHADDLAVRADAALTKVDVAALDRDVHALIDQLSAMATRGESFLVNLEEEGGPLRRLLADVESVADRARTVLDSLDVAVSDADLAATSGAVQGVAREAAALSGDARETLARLRETLVAFRALAELLERQPGAVLRGHATEFQPRGDR